MADPGDLSGHDVIAISCVRVIDMINPKHYSIAAYERCQDCGREVIVSQEGCTFAREHPNAIYMCVQCSLIGGKTFIGGVPGAFEAVERALGPEHARRAQQDAETLGRLAQEAHERGQDHELAAVYDVLYGSAPRKAAAKAAVRRAKRGKRR